MDQNAFIAQIAGAARTGSDKILASLTIAQGCLESEYGTSELATEAFNLFGIKPGSSWTGATISLPTTEYDDAGNASTVQADFRKYGSWDESIADHLQLLTGLDRYANLIGEKDFARASVLILRDGYATDPQYSGKLQAIYAEYDLGQYDVQDDCPEWARGARDLLVKYGVTDGTRPNDGVTRAELWTMMNNLWYAIEHKQGS